MKLERFTDKAREAIHEASKDWPSVIILGSIEIEHLLAALLMQEDGW